jgi:Ribosomal L27 protein
LNGTCSSGERERGRERESEMNSFIILRSSIRGIRCSSIFGCNNVLSGPSRMNEMILGKNGNDTICDDRRLGGIRGAKKKAGGSTTNGRESAGRRLGIKVWPNRFASTFPT